MHVWDVLSAHDDNSPYGDVPIGEVIGSIIGTPTVGLELGCNRGATGAELKRRYPGLYYAGVEINPDAAKVAAERLDEVVTEDFLAWRGKFAVPGGKPFDLVVATDVLEHLYNPWATLRKIRPLLAPDAKVYATIPNVRNAWLMGELARGDWNYERIGLLDITHIRFFTFKSAVALFQETGYKIHSAIAIRDPRLPEIAAPTDQPIDLRMDGLTLHNVDAQAFAELTAIKFLFIAEPAPV